MLEPTAVRQMWFWLDRSSQSSCGRDFEFIHWFFSFYSVPTGAFDQIFTNILHNSVILLLKQTTKPFISILFNNGSVEKLREISQLSITTSFITKSFHVFTAEMQSIIYEQFGGEAKVNVDGCVIK